MKPTITPLRHILAALAIIVANTTQAQNPVADDGSPSNLYRNPVGKAELDFVNTNLPWGKTTGSHAVTPTGAAAYTIPITLPPGTAGMAPNLSINYNSQGGDGPMGFGWGISGQSAISRVKKDIMHDDKVQTIQWNNQDAIALDGVRLMKMSGSDLAAGAVYGKEVEDFSKVYVYSYEGQPYFEVWTKEGLVYRYGYNADARIFHSSGAVYMWLLDKVRDLNGNYYTLEYAPQASGTKVLTAIKYTGNAQSTPVLTPYWEVKFEYLTRNDVNEIFMPGLSLHVGNLLRRIIIKRISDGVVAKKYFFNYASINNRSQLREITEVGKNGTTLNSTVIKYEGIGAAYTIENSISDGMENNIWLSGDFDGNGRSDLVTFNYASASGNYNYYDKCTLYSGDGADFQPLFTHTFSPSVHVQKENSLYPFRSFDYNGDGIDDIVTLKVIQEGLYTKLEQVLIYESPFTGSLPAPTVINMPGNLQVYENNPKSVFIPGDYNGDGRMDFISVMADVGESDYHAYLHLSGTGSTLQDLGLADSWADEDELLVIDFNGDGVSDILDVSGNQSRIYTIQETTLWTMTQVYQSGFPTAWHRLYPGDFNGDGLTDLLEYNNVNWRVAYSTGTGFIEELLTYTNSINTNEELSHIEVGDFNGDGRSDFIEIEKASGQDTSSITCYKSTGKSFVQQHLTTGGFYINGGQSYLADYDGDGKTDLLYRNALSSSNPMELLQVDVGGHDRLAQYISDGYAYVCEFEYKPLTYAGVYYKGAPETYPLCKVQLPLYVVKRTSLPGCAGSGTLDTYYRYSEALVHKQGRGFLGFKQITTYDPFSLNVEHYQDYYIQPGVFLPFATYGLTIADPHNVSSHRINAEYVSLSNGRWWLRTNWTRDQDFINQASTHVTFIYDSWGNATTVLKRIGEDLAGGGTPQHQVYSYFTYGSLHSLANPGKITSTEVSHLRTGEVQVSKKTNFEYLGGDHLLQKVVEWPGMARELTTAYSSWNDFGQPERTTLSSPGELSIINQHIYDTRGRYVEETINALDQHAYAEYDEFSGKPLSTQSVDGLVAGYTYDEFYRVATATDVLGNTETITYTWDLEPGSETGETSVENAWYHVTRSKAGEPVHTTWYDMLDRVREVRITGFNNDSIRTVTSYRPAGQVKSTTLPFSNPVDAIITHYNYHPDLQYITGKSDPYSTVVYTYANTPGNNILPKYQRVTVTSPSGTTWKKTDMSGKVQQSHDEGGTLAFFYDSWGNTRKVSKNSQDLNTMTYDAYGRQATLTPAGAGTWQYTYNAYGQLVSQKDPLNIVHTTVFDVLGRVAQESGPEGVTTYSYVNSGNGLNKLASITGFNGIVKSYAYDSYNRLQEMESLMGFPMTCTYSYTSSGRLEETEYSTGFSIRNIYDDNGYLWKKNYVDDNGQQLLLEVNTQNPLGRSTEFWLGNGKTSEVEYNHYGMPEHYFTPGVQDLETSFHPGTGNVLSRAEGLRSEAFFYDNQQRLQNSQVTYNGNNLPLLETGLDARGDIVEKHDAGSLYDYNGQYQVRHVKNDFWEIPAPTQSVSYTAFNEPDEIEENDNRVEFVYGPDKSRIQSRIYLNGSGTFSELRHYLPEMGYEVVKTGSDEHHLYYIPLTANTIVILKHGTEPNTEGSLVDFYYVYTDHLGSWLKFTNDQGTIIAQQDFDAWGRRRIPQSWDYPGAAPLQPWIIRGYTGHEHLDEFGIVHMNGRLYDPVIGRMFSPDNFVQAPYYTQAYNRYSYAFNNPLKYTDPSGEITWFDVVAGAALVGGAVMIATGVGAPIGTGLVVAGFGHYAHTIAQVQNGKEWNEASRWAGISMSMTTTVGATTGPGSLSTPSQNSYSSGPIDWTNVDGARGYESEYYAFSPGPSVMDNYTAYEGGPMVASNDPMDGYLPAAQTHDAIRFSDSFEALDMNQRTVIYGTRAKYGFEFVEFNSAKPAAGVDIRRTGGGVVIYRQATMDQELAKTFHNDPGAPVSDPNKLYFRAWMSNGDPNGGGWWQYGWFWSVHPNYPNDQPQQW